MTADLDEIRETGEWLRRVGKAALIALSLTCGVAMVWVVGAVVFA